jgi:hypothetical protein
MCVRRGIGRATILETQATARKLMPTIKRIVVLANSVKHDPGRCVAGREIIGSKKPQVGGWVRPVSTVGEGELLNRHMQVAGGGLISVLDVVDVQLVSLGADRSQPENWIIDESVPWKRAGLWPKNRLAELTESPSEIWCQPGTKRDRASAAYIGVNPPTQSLYFLGLPKAYVYRNRWSKIRLSFSYMDIPYDFAVTDPFIRGRLERQGTDSFELELPWVCVSLAPAFRGDHYKVVATVIE